MTTMFLYPKSRQYPVDEVCEQIVRALEARNFDVPNIRVEFYGSGSGEQHFRYVSVIEGSDFRLTFGRFQGTLPGGCWSDVAAVSGLSVNRKVIHIYKDESGPSLRLYVGSDWELDKAAFMRGWSCNSKLDGKPRTYLCYRAVCNCGSSTYTHTHPGHRAPLLIADNDLGREYDPEPGDPTSFRTADVLEEFRVYLRDVVLAAIEAAPIPEVKLDLFPEPEPIPFPATFGPFYAFCDAEDAQRIEQGQHDRTELPEHQRFALGTNWRLVSLGVSADGTFPEIAYDGFLWCSRKPKLHDRLPEMRPSSSWCAPPRVVRVAPKTANGIYIIDQAVYETRRRELAEAANLLAVKQGRQLPDRFTQAEVDDFVRARARTLVSIHEYKGGYKDPVVLVHRELMFDEVELCGLVCTDR